MRGLRADVEQKVHRLPLEYFDRQPRGELLSRVTNDIDNVSQTLQQTFSQLLTSLLTVVAVIAGEFGCGFWTTPSISLRISTSRETSEPGLLVVSTSSLT